MRDSLAIQAVSVSGAVVCGQFDSIGIECSRGHGNTLRACHLQLPEHFFQARDVQVTDGSRVSVRQLQAAYGHHGPGGIAKDRPSQIDRNRLVLAICIRRNAGDFVAGKIQTDRHSVPPLVGVDEVLDRLLAPDQRAFVKCQDVRNYSTITDLERFLGWSTLCPQRTAM